MRQEQFGYWACSPTVQDRASTLRKVLPLARCFRGCVEAAGGPWSAEEQSHNPHRGNPIHSGRHRVWSAESGCWNFGLSRGRQNLAERMRSWRGTQASCRADRR